MHIAIVGAGFCGLATAWYLFQLLPPLSISSLTLFDSQGIGGGASGIAAGLLHPYAGAHAKLNRMGKEGMEATLHLIRVASQFLNQPVAIEQGILRLALTDQQIEDFLLCQHKYPADIEWLSTEQCQQLFPYLTQAPGIWIKQGAIVNSPSYLKGLWQACAQQGAILEAHAIVNWDELKEFDLAIVTTGAAAGPFLPPSAPSLSLVKGQVLELEWPSSIPPLPFALNSHAYLIMNAHQSTCLVGATFERDYTTIQPDQERAKAEILPKVVHMLPCLASARVINCYAGLRAVTPNHLPFIERLDQKRWVLTGMGSKGLLYHALLAKQLVKKILEE